MENALTDSIEPVEWVYIDMQGFKVNKNRFMCKEFCLISSDETFHAIVKPWFSYKKLLSHYKRQIDWLTKYYHGIDFESGDMHIDELAEIVYPKLTGKIAIVKGNEKMQWLQYIFRKHGEIRCRNIEEFNCDEINDQTHESHALCEYHNARFGWSQCRCALSNTLKLQIISNINAPIRFF